MTDSLRVSQITTALSAPTDNAGHIKDIRHIKGVRHIKGMRHIKDTGHVKKDYKVFMPQTTIGTANTNKKEMYKDQKATPFKKKSDIQKMVDYFKSNYKYRDLCLFVVGINIGLRCSDLVNIKVCDVVGEDRVVVDEFRIIEKKTSKTKGREKQYVDINALAGLTDDEIVKTITKKASKKKITPKVKKVCLNDSAKQAIQMLVNSRCYKYDDYLFYNDSNNAGKKNEHLTVQGVNYILLNAAKACGIDGVHATSHSLRKTFGYHFYMQNSSDPRCLVKLQKIFNHSSASTTLDYIGLTDDEIKESWDVLNLGL